MSEQRYEIRTVADFLKVPEARWEACLKDFRCWLEVLRAVQPFQEAGIGVRMNAEFFGWIDDDKHDAVVNIAIIHEPPVAP